MLFANKYTNICRTCALENENMKPIFSSSDYGDCKDSLSVVLMSFTSLRMFKGDGLPEHICISCFQEIDKLLSFRNLCKSSDNILRQAVIKNDYSVKYDENLRLLDSNIVQQNNYNGLALKVDKHERKVYPCENCKMACLGLGQYRRHIIESHLLKCDICDQGFKSKSQLVHHLSIHNQPETKKRFNLKKKRKLPRTCDICNKTFHFHSNLKRHKLTHTGEKPYLCNVCGKGFAQMSYLKIHAFIHTGQKPYQCNVCERCFSAPGTLITHRRTHTGERPHVCQMCGKDFPQAGYLASHIRTHTGEKPAECQVCNRRFNQSGRLNVHMRIHSGEKPYNCVECGRSFAVRGTLTKHIRTHTGERPYICSVCGQSFAQSGTLATHMKVHNRT